jgi:hypothetical protein
MGMIEVLLFVQKDTGSAAAGGVDAADPGGYRGTIDIQD